ncbi:DUF924 family protein [Prosthecomicrobium pneumaticum]|uniref:Uncharacterized protein (DUF924 family) n=1 Tax=Prosthecomicrobium pneumaticum TaxID=81895 RepID=A0A7W9FM27_9HYPH|nr:DUF924 family protein [Prosthecomicrobium pneumaticum]MBB5753175.1 uncharacterized protein (DUF924 family) [Prosthecomicrobium pneumaticum]
MDRTILAEAHDWWCGQLADITDFPIEKSRRWFDRSEETDGYIRATFGPYLDAVAAHDWALSELTREEAVGLVLFLDQFPRNIFRKNAQAFAYDGVALDHARAVIEGGLSDFCLVERVFLFLPFEHSEEMSDQDRSIALFASLLLQAPDDQKEIYREFFKYAYLHWDLIRRFGRFPHRNADLGRETTPQEAEFLAKNGRGY